MVKKADTDVEMKDVSSPAKKEKSENVDGVTEEAPKDPDLLTLEDIKEYMKYIEKSVATKEPRYLSRVIRGLNAVRSRLNPLVLRRLLQGYIQAPAQTGVREELLAFLDEPMESIVGPPFRPRSAKLASNPIIPEMEVYLHLLVLMYLVDQKKFDKAVMCSGRLMDKLQHQNRRSLDILAARCYFYHSRAYELTNKLDSIRVLLHTRLQTSVLRSDYYGQASLLNLLLRNYLHYNLIEQADKLVSKSTFPESASNNEWARFLYYLGRIKAAQLEYSEAHKHLLQALRKAPQHAAIGFKQTVTVRTGNLPRFNEVLSQYGAKFQSEDTYTLIIRLRHNVIKTGVRMINLSYSRISLVDIAQKLTLDSPEDAEYIVAKAIRDGVIEATIDHEKGYVQSKETSDVYMTREPQAAFHQRITFCLDIHNHSVKAMRFPPKSYNKDLESAEERREREQLELESAKEIADDDFDGFP